MKLRYKLALSIFLISTLALVITIATFSTFTNQRTILKELETNKENVQYISESIEKDILELVRLTQTIASTDSIHDSLILSNDYFASFSSNDRLDTINTLNSTWMDTDDIDDPFIKIRMENDVASYLNSQQENSPDLFGEIFLTNIYGVMISTTGKLTTLAHFDKYWWQGAYDNSDGMIYIDDRGYDESVSGYVLGIVVPIYDDSNQMIGILKSNYNISEFFEDSIAYFRDLNSDGRLIVARTLGLIINDELIEPLSESIDSLLIPYLESNTIISKEQEIEDNKYLLSIAPIDITYDTPLITFGGSYDSIDHIGGNVGEGWSVIYLIDEDTALTGENNTLAIYLYLGLAIILINSVIALIVGRSLSAPMTDLHKYILSVSSGDLTKKNLKIYNDEIGELTVSFNQMIDNLNATLITKDKLSYEKDLAQLYLDLASVILLVVNREGNVTLINKKGYSILGYENAEDIYNKNWFDTFIPKLIKNDVKQVFEQTLNGDTKLAAHHENTVVTKDGTELLISWDNAMLYDINGQITGVLSSGEDVTELRQYEEKLKEMGYRDVLTGLYNRRYYEEKLAIYDTDENYPLTLVMADINGLKLINDAFGHDSGDQLLISAANALRAACRDEDFISRVGGDEFVIVMPKTDEKSAEKVIANINKKVDAMTIESIKISISFGYNTKHYKSEDIQVVFKGAEDYMYREKISETRSMRSGTIETILATLYQKNKDAEIHSKNVSVFSERLAIACGMNHQEIGDVKTAGLLHDIGKIIIPSSIIEKKGELTDKELNTIKSHPEIGFRILSSSQELASIANIILNHHERWDGTGYPRGIKSKDIPIQSRIISISEAFDVMTRRNSYRKKVSYEEAKEEILNNSGTQFDPSLVKIFIDNFEMITTINKNETK